MHDTAQTLLKYMIHSGALSLNPSPHDGNWIRMKSGRLSPYFFNTGEVTDGIGLSIIAQAYTHTLDPLVTSDSTVLLGSPYKGIVLAPIVTMRMSALNHKNMHWASWRKEPKKHGEGGTSLGYSLHAGDTVVVIDDVITDGASKREAMQYITEHHATPAGIIILFDRQERISDSDTRSVADVLSRTYNIPVRSVANFSDLLRLIEAQDGLTKDQEQVLKNLRTYRDRYGSTE